MNIGHGAELRWVITADLVAAGQGLHARSVCPAHHTLLLLTTGRLLVLTIDFTKEIVLVEKLIFTNIISLVIQFSQISCQAPNVGGVFRC